MSHDRTLESVRQLGILGESATTERVAALLAAVDAAPYEPETVRLTLEALADQKRLGRLHVAVRVDDAPTTWTTTYFATSHTMKHTA
jgi:hypothetical protein